MNELIQELLGQCQIETYGVNGELLEFGFDAEKFAELIVRECANVCKQIGDSHISDLDGSPEFGSGAYFSAKRITQHFGVEE